MKHYPVNTRRRSSAIACLIPILFFSIMGAYADEYVDTTTQRKWVEEMQQRPQGPFRRLRWFCKDGSVLAPQPYACSEHGGGVQHGEWSKHTKSLREQGYFIATLLADEDTHLTVAPEHTESFYQLLIERYLMAVDDGWIMRKARFYRGSMQAEDEIRGARKVLQKLVQSEDWLTQAYVPLRIAVRALPHGIETPSVLKMRQMAIDLSSADKKFLPLRNKIHISPDKSDARAVRNYASELNSKNAKKYIQLADLIDEIYARPALNIPISRLSKRVRKMPDMSRSLRDMSARLISSRDAEVLFSTTANTMMVLRDHLVEVPKAGVRLDVLDTSVLLEVEHFDLGRELLGELTNTPRSQRLDWLKSSLKATYATGLLSRREYDAMGLALEHLGGREIQLAEYKKELNYLARVPAWAAKNLRLHFYQAMKKLSEIEPLAELFIQDQLRGSPLFFYVEVLDSLVRDANHLAGIQSQFFGEKVGTGLTSLNPGLARGVLHLTSLNGNTTEFEEEGIYLLPETVADLPPVAGIVTAGAGNPLSHVQLLARNLGIPNVSIDETLMTKLRDYENKQVILAVSPGGVVRLFEDDGSYAAIFQQQASEPTVTIQPDIQKLDLENLSFFPLSQLRATDSGISVGPKAAKLGELYHHFPDRVANGLTIPFAVFRQLLEQPMPDVDSRVFDWMVDQYQLMADMPMGSEQRKKAEMEFRTKLSNWIEQADPGKSFRLRLADDMEKVFGQDGSYGVFVRSDTNVEDLPNFTGAGLNLTVPNVIGFDNILNAISRVWASPFSERAFAWRQSHMQQPEHVYPAILLMRSVAAEKSGVMVTQDIDTGEMDWISIAVNEGVGGAVDGQAAESIKVNINTGVSKLMAQASARSKRILTKSGGVSEVPVSGSDTVLQANEIRDLIEFSQQIPEKFPEIIDENGNPGSADIEFGFIDGRLQLFQIRPFLESNRARGSEYLISMDKESLSTTGTTVILDDVPD